MTTEARTTILNIPSWVFFPVVAYILLTFDYR